MLNADRPVLVVPAVGHYPHLGCKVLAAWNGGRQALRALTSALPLLQQAEIVDLIVFNADHDGDHGA